MQQSGLGGYGHIIQMRTKKRTNSVRPAYRFTFHEEEKAYKNGQKQTKNGYRANPP